MLTLGRNAEVIAKILGDFIVFIQRVSYLMIGVVNIFCLLIFISAVLNKLQKLFDLAPLMRIHYSKHEFVFNVNGDK